MRPGVKLADDLVIGQPGGHYSPHNRVRGHSRYSDISGAAEPVLAGVLASYGIIYSLAAKSRVDHDRPAAEPVLDQFQKHRQPLQVCPSCGIWGVVQSPVICDGEFLKGEMIT